MEHLVVTRKPDYTIVQLNRGKVNAINHDLVKEFRKTMKVLSSDSTVRGVIISGKPNFYSAGLDLKEIYYYNEDEIAEFFKDFGNLYLELVKFPKPLIAAITGHSPAGGTVIAITCDHRVMANAEKFTIGLNEVAVNIQISEDILRAYKFWLGEGLASRFILEGKLLKADEALKVGLVNEICPVEEVVERAEKQMQKFLIADDGIFQSTKYKARKEWINSLNTDGGTAFEESVKSWWRPEIRQRMKMFVDILNKK